MSVSNQKVEQGPLQLSDSTTSVSPLRYLLFARPDNDLRTMTKQSLKKLPVAQAIQALRSGTGAEKLSSGIKSVSFSYVTKRAGKGTTQFISTTLPRLSYSNPTIVFDVKELPSVRTKSKDPELVKKAEEALKVEESLEGGKKEREKVRMIVGFGEGTQKDVDLTGYSSSEILKALQSVQA